MSETLMMVPRLFASCGYISQVPKSSISDQHFLCSGRERVRAQIAQDRAEKAAKFNQLQQEEDERRKQRELEKQQQAAAEAERLAAARRYEDQFFSSFVNCSYVGHRLPSRFENDRSLHFFYPHRHFLYLVW